MIRTSVHHHNHLLAQHHFAETPITISRLKEQQCLSLLKKCNNMVEFKQTHSHFIKLGFFFDSFCSSSLLSTCALAEWGCMDYACSIFRQIEDPGSYDFNILIRGYANDMNFDDALLMFVEMVDRRVEPDNFTYPSLLKAVSLLSAIDEGMQIHAQIIKLGLGDDLFVQNSLINLYGKCGKISHSYSIFENMKQRSVASWSSIIAAHAQLGMWDECLKLFENMNITECFKLEESIIVSVLSSCTHLGALDLGRCVHGFALKNLNRLNVVVETSLIDMYVKCGCIEKGLFLFNEMVNKNKLTYSVMITGLAMHGHGREALRVFSGMMDEGFLPDDIIYVGVLRACSNEGLVKQGLDYFNKMRSEFGIEPTVQHYGCLVDLMGRNGMIDEAFNLIKSMPMEPNDICWRSLLSACKLHHNLEIGESVAKTLFESSNLKNAADYIMMSNLYAQAHKWEKVSKTRKQMANDGLIHNQTPGFSIVEVKRRFYKFVSQDMKFPQCKGVYEMIYQMEWQLQFEGYSADLSQILFDIDDEEKRRRLRAHSQKLAIAFALIHTTKETPVRIVRNLRMCSDCHAYTKLISIVFERVIMVRDGNRFHCFKDGACSCKDYGR